MTVITTVGLKNDHAADVYSKLLTDRVVFLNGEVGEENCDLLVAQLMYLDSVNQDDIKLYINSPGGLVTAGLAVYDAMRIIKSDVQTVVLGQACSMGAYLLSQGKKGKRYAGESARIMIHQVSSGTRGKVSEQIISLEESKRLNEYLTKKIAIACGKEYDEVFKDMKEDLFMSAEEALAYGLIDKII